MPSIKPDKDKTLSTPQEKSQKQPLPEPSVTKASGLQAVPTGADAQIPRPSKTEEQKPSTIPDLPNNSIPSNAKGSLIKSDQEMLDSALEFCQASNDYWERGDLDNALDALDQAYSLILKVDPNHNPEILQQRDDLRFTISKRIIEIYTSRFTVANGNYKVIPLVMNSHVARALDLFKGRERNFFQDAYCRSGRYRPAIVKALKEAGLPEELSWLPLIESGFKVNALSRARALGPWQFIASTGYKYGLKRDRWVDERMDPEKSTKAAIAYLKELHQIFGDWATALAAYNCGEGTVLRCIRTQKINYLDHFWDLYEKLPRETAFYVPRFLAVLHILNDPKAHGFNLPPVEEELETEEVTIDKPIHVKTIADQLQISYKLLKELNPELKRDSTPSRPHAFNVPRGKGPLLLAKLEDMPAWNPPIPAHERHRVRKGDTLSLIARRYRTSVRAIMALNGLESSKYIKAGWNLKIPTGRKYEALSKPTPPASGSEPKVTLSHYAVRKGDSLWKIANQFGTTTKAIQALNQLDDTHLRIGQALLIPKGMSEDEKITTKSYRVSKGDSSFLIAQKHQMNLSEFLRLNHLTPRSTIYPGQVLLVKAE
jgi:membrane-bound lytic murein transglycosylase D